MIAAYHKARGDKERTEFLIPDNAHGTNPASARMAASQRCQSPQVPMAISIRVPQKGCFQKNRWPHDDKPQYPWSLQPKNPRNHQDRSCCRRPSYYDGANLNAIMNMAKPGAMGFDVMHINLHKTFSTPHGGGGPGSGPVLCNSRLMEFLPVRVLSKMARSTALDGMTIKASGKCRLSTEILPSTYGHICI